MAANRPGVAIPSVALRWLGGADACHRLVATGQPRARLSAATALSEASHGRGGARAGAVAASGRERRVDALVTVRKGSLSFMGGVLFTAAMFALGPPSGPAAGMGVRHADAVVNGLALKTEGFGGMIGACGGRAGFFS